jgi:hypothetical protein
MLAVVAFGQVHGQSDADINVNAPAPWRSDLPAGQAPQDNVRPGTVVDRRGYVRFRLPNDFGDGMREQVEPMGPMAFAFVPGHYYTSNNAASNQESLNITEYDGTGMVAGSYTVPFALAEEIRGLAFGADGFLYATMSRGSSGFAVLALESDGDVVASYAGSVYVAGNLSYGKIAMDNQYLYVCGQNVLTRFLLGDPLSGTTIYTENQVFDVKPLPNGNLFVASAIYVDEITTSGVFVRRIQLTGTNSFFYDIRGIEYNSGTDMLFVTHLGYTGFSDRIMRVNATTGALMGSAVFSYAGDLFLDSSGKLLVGSRTQSPAFFSQELTHGNSLNSGRQMFVTQYYPAQAPPAQALNISTRMRVETGNNVLIGGFIVTGSAPKTVAVRGIGPSLAGAGINDVLADPILELRDGSGALLFQNDDWQDDRTQAAAITALGLAPGDPKESTIMATLQPSASYTAILSGKNNGTGVGLVEIYDTNRTADSQLANISSRGFVQSGENVMIGGFILGGSSGTAIAVRGMGPSLSQAGVSDVLADPVLELRDSNGALLISNDNWQDSPLQAAQLSAHGLAPPSFLEAGIYAPLPAGAFTAILSGKNGGTGIGLVEIYNVP